MKFSAYWIASYGRYEDDYSCGSFEIMVDNYGSVAKVAMEIVKDENCGASITIDIYDENDNYMDTVCSE